MKFTVELTHLNKKYKIRNIKAYSEDLAIYKAKGYVCKKYESTIADDFCCVIAYLQDDKDSLNPFFELFGDNNPFK